MKDGALVKIYMLDVVSLTRIQTKFSCWSLLNSLQSLIDSFPLELILIAIITGDPGNGIGIL